MESIKNTIEKIPLLSTNAGPKYILIIKRVFFDHLVGMING